MRLLTLVGAGGVGKTRLALRVAGDLIGQVPDGVWLVELAALQDSSLVPQAVAAVLGMRERADEPLPVTLGDVLRAQHVLLVLDNCEHLIGACAELVEYLLRGCPGLRVLTTGRQPLGLAGETTWRVPSLAVLDASARPCIDEIAASEAVRMFLERARAALPGFALTDRNARSGSSKLWPAWTIAFDCSAMPARARRPDSEPCARPSSGAMTCCPKRSVCYSDVLPCLPAAGVWKPPSPSAALRRWRLMR